MEYPSLLRTRRPPGRLLPTVFGGDQFAHIRQEVVGRVFGSNTSSMA